LQVHDVDELKQRLIDVWHHLSKVSSMTQLISGANVFAHEFV